MPLKHWLNGYFLIVASFQLSAVTDTHPGSLHAHFLYVMLRNKMVPCLTQHRTWYMLEIPQYRLMSRRAELKTRPSSQILMSCSFWCSIKVSQGGTKLKSLLAHRTGRTQIKSKAGVRGREETAVPVALAIFSAQGSQALAEGLSQKKLSSGATLPREACHWGSTDSFPRVSGVWCWSHPLANHSAGGYC